MTPETPTPEVLGLKVQIYDSQGAPWPDAVVFAGTDGAGPMATTGPSGRVVLEGVDGPATISVYHSFTARYNSRDSYTVNRISTFADVGAEGDVVLELFRDQGYGGEPRPVASPAGWVGGVDTGADATRIFVLCGGEEWSSEPTAVSMPWELTATEVPTWAYGAQVQGDGDGRWSSSSIPERFDLRLDIGRAGGDLDLSHHFDGFIPLELGGVDAEADQMGGRLGWILPGGAGTLSFEASGLTLTPGEAVSFPAPPEHSEWAGDALSLEVIAEGWEREQSRTLGPVFRGLSTAVDLYPVPSVRARLPLRSNTLAGASLEVGHTDGAAETLFFFTERWYKLEPTSYTLWYDVWSVSLEGAAHSVVVPRLPAGLPWPAALTGNWRDLERYSYLQARYVDGYSRRGLQTAASDP